MGGILRAAALRWLGLEDVVLQLDALKLRVRVAEDDIQELLDRQAGWPPMDRTKGGDA